jgi:hypothetical protein
MKKIFFTSIFMLLLTPVFSQMYTESKSCGSCGKEVPITSRIGMRCPHCNVRWGYENSSTRRKTTSSRRKKSYRRRR